MKNNIRKNSVVRIYFPVHVSCQKSGGKITANSHFIVHYFVKYVKRILSCFYFSFQRFILQNETQKINNFIPRFSYYLYTFSYIKRSIFKTFLFSSIFLQNTTPGQNQDFAIQSPASGSPLPAGTGSNTTTGTTDSNNSVQNNTTNQQAGGPNTVLRVIVESLLYPVTLDVLHQIFQRFGKVLKIVTFTKNNSFQVSFLLLLNFILLILMEFISFFLISYLYFTCNLLENFILMAI